MANIFRTHFEIHLLLKSSPQEEFRTLGIIMTNKLLRHFFSILNFEILLKHLLGIINWKKSMIKIQSFEIFLHQRLAILYNFNDNDLTLLAISTAFLKGEEFGSTDLAK